MTFDHRDAGTPEHAWTPLIDALPLLDPPGPHDHVAVLAAHPDDETLGAGGLLALAASIGARVTLVVATDGENSHPTSPTTRPEQLACRRRRELYAAIAELAPAADVRLLGLPDGRLAEHCAELASALAEINPPPTVLVTPWIGDQHPDHAAGARAGATIAKAVGARHWQYPIWGWHWAQPDGGMLPVDRMACIALDGAANRAKAGALDRHASQHRSLSPQAGDEAVLGPGMLEHFRRPVEVFVVNDANDLVSGAYFDELYASTPDPWGLAERFYERRKRATLLAALTRPRFRRAFEPGCATGLLTADLARRCDAVVAWDIADAAVARARERVDEWAHVQVQRGMIPDHWPSGSFDLIVISEIGYYCTDLTALTHRIDDSLAQHGLLVACHWRHPAPMHPHTAGAVHGALGAGRHLLLTHIEDDFLLQAWSPDPASVAVRERIVP
jgi:LmbE family N-acetylglucosaminyl deacetylase/SAM-dependent methyltransferase